jgi:hypothetical protein
MTLLGWLVLVLVCLIALALYLKGDVRAMVKCAFLTFSLEAKDKKRRTR